MDELDHNIRLRADAEHRRENHPPPPLVEGVSGSGSSTRFFSPGTGVGGAGEHWGRASFHFLPDLFVRQTHLNEKHGAAKLPADLAVQGWGVTARPARTLLLEIRAC